MERKSEFQLYVLTKLSGYFTKEREEEKLFPFHSSLL